MLNVFERRLFVRTAAIVGIVLAAILPVAWRVAFSRANRSIQAELERTHKVLFDTLTAQRKSMLRSAQRFADDSTLRRLVSAARVNPDSAAVHASLLGQAKRAAAVLGVPRTQIVGADGTLLARSDDPKAYGVLLTDDVLAMRALEGHQAYGFAVAEGMLAQAVAVPIAGATGPRMGVLMAFRMIDETIASIIGELTGSELIVYHVPPGGSPEVAVATPNLGDRVKLRALIDTTFVAGPAMPRGDSSDATSITTFGEDRELVISNRHYVGDRLSALNPDGSEVGGFITLRDRDAELDAFYKLRRVLLVIGGVCLGGAFVLSSMRVVRPRRSV